MIGTERYARLLEPCLAQAAGYARSILRNRHQAQDAVQQAALRGLERIRTFDQAKSFKGWWFVILRNCCIDMIRTDKRATHVSLDDLDTPADTPAEVSDWQRLGSCMETLSTDHRDILRLKYFAELSYRELATALSIPQGTVMSRLHLARIALAAKMREEEL
jgi:RNA polymerase sigma-70 factor (ECF subfamily)